MKISFVTLATCLALLSRDGEASPTNNANDAIVEACASDGLVAGASCLCGPATCDVESHCKLATGDVPATCTPPGPALEQLKMPDPRIVIVGATGAGKSSMANALLGCDPRKKGCNFPVCRGLKSCTKQTTVGTGPWLGNGQHFTVVDTPGFGDSAGEDNELIDEMMEVLDGTLGYTNAIVLLIDGNLARFSAGLHNMLRQMSSLFGDTWWDYMIIGVSKWKYTQEAIDERQADCDEYGELSEDCKNEEWFMREITAQLKEKFKLDRTFTFTFLHSFSQSGQRALDDKVQQEHYQAQAKILWDFATTRKTKFEFKTIDDVLEENNHLKKEHKRLNDIIEKNINNLFTLVVQNEKRIDSNEEKTNTALEGVVNDVSNLKTVPLGTIIAWISRPTSDGEAVDIPEGFIRCDGTTIPQPSIWAGQITPDLNHGRRFLRGGADKDMLKMEDDTLQDHVHSFHDPGHEHDITDKGHRHGYDDKYPNWDYGNSDDGYTGPLFVDAQNDRFDKSHSRTSSSSHTGITVNSKSTGIKVGAVTSSYRRGSETKPRNMNVIYIIRVW